MWIRRPAVLHAAIGLFTVGLVFAAAVAARAETTELQACATQYQAAKTDNKLNGQPWQDFFAECKAHLSAATTPKTESTEAPEAPAEAAVAPKAAAATQEPTEPQPAAAAAAPTAPAKDENADADAREKKCRAEWKVELTELKKKDSKLTWNKYLKKCNAHLMGAKE